MTPLEIRIDTWVSYATKNGYNLTRILLHPDDAKNPLVRTPAARDALEVKYNLPVEFL